jgi:hypothetical protein
MANAQPSDISVSISSESCAPHIKNAQLAAKYLPKHGEHPITSAVIIRGINNAIANGLRRILLTEMDNFALQMDADSWETDDPFVMVDMIMRRLLLIPLVQKNVHEGDEFALTFANNTDATADVMSANLRATRPGEKSRAFFETINIVTLQPHCRIKFLAHVTRGNGSQDAAFATASMAVAIPLDERPAKRIPILTESAQYEFAPTVAPAFVPVNKDARYIESVSLSDPRQYLIRFESCGKGDTREIMARATASLIARMRALERAQIIAGPAQISHAREDAMDMHEDGIYHMRIPDETYTVGEIFAKCALSLFPGLNFAACHVNDLNNELIIRIFSRQDDVHTVVTRTITYAIGILETILRYF